MQWETEAATMNGIECVMELYAVRRPRESEMLYSPATRGPVRRLASVPAGRSAKGPWASIRVGHGVSLYFML